MDLLRNDEVRFFSFQRHYVGLVTGEDIRTIIQMAEGRGQLRFIFRDGDYSQCSGRQNGTHCKQVAALALLCLQEHEDLTMLVAELFLDSPWAIIAKYLHDRASMTSSSLQIRKKNSHWLLETQTTN